MRLLASLLFIQASFSIAQVEIKMLAKYELSGSISSVEENYYYPSGENLILEQTKLFAFDGRGRLKNDAVSSNDYGSSEARYVYENDRMIKSEFIEEGILNRQIHTYSNGNHVSTHYFIENAGTLELDYKDTLTYLENYFHVKSFNSAGIEFNVKDVYKDQKGRDTLHIGFLQTGEKEYERHFEYIPETDLFIDKTIINDSVIAITNYECKVDGTHVLTTIDPNHEIFMIRELRYNIEGFLSYYFIDEPMRGASSFIEYTYNYDDRGNWVQRKAVDKAGELFEVVERSIVYFE